MELVPLCSPRTPAEEAVLISLLAGEGIFFTVSNDVFGSLKVGPVIPLYNEKTILVPEDELERSRALIAPPDEDPARTPESAVDWWDRLRVLLEVLVFNWVIPTPRWRRR